MGSGSEALLDALVRCPIKVCLFTAIDSAVLFKVRHQAIVGHLNGINRRRRLGDQAQDEQDGRRERPGPDPAEGRAGRRRSPWRPSMAAGAPDGRRAGERPGRAGRPVPWPFAAPRLSVASVIARPRLPARPFAPQALAPAAPKRGAPGPRRPGMRPARGPRFRQRPAAGTCRPAPVHTLQEFQTPPRPRLRAGDPSKRPARSPDAHAHRISKASAPDVSVNRARRTPVLGPSTPHLRMLRSTAATQNRLVTSRTPVCVRT